MKTKTEPINILVTNDDGIRSRGITELTKAMSALGNVYVCAPEGQRSASGHSITVRDPITVEELLLPHARIAMQFSGTPADCVKMGIQLLRQRGVDIHIVYSGINHGGNLGTDTLYSGTVSAAVEGVLCGLPAVAVSVDSHNPSHFSTACRLAAKFFPKALAGLPPGIALNINVPNLPEGEVKGLVVAPLGVRQYVERFEETRDGEGRLAYCYRGLPVVYDCRELSNDVLASQEEYATITPLRYDLTDHAMLERIKEWEMEE